MWSANKLTGSTGVEASHWRLMETQSNVLSSFNIIIIFFLTRITGVRNTTRNQQTPLQSDHSILVVVACFMYSQSIVTTENRSV